MKAEMNGDLSLAGSLIIGNITIYASGEVDYPDDISKAAKEFWEAVIYAFPGVFESSFCSNHIIINGKENNGKTNA